MTSSSTQVLSIKRKLLAAVATLTIVGGVSAAATGAASAATPQCTAAATVCISVFSSELGTYEQPNFAEAVLGGGGANVGQHVGLKPASRFDPSQDILPDAPGELTDPAPSSSGDGALAHSASVRM